MSCAISTTTQRWARALLSSTFVAGALVVATMTPTVAEVHVSGEAHARPPIAERGATRPRSEAPVFVADRGRFTAFDAPGLGSNYFPRINNRGDVVGIYNKELREPIGVFGGYLRDKRGRFTEVAVPGSQSTSPLDVNDRGDVVGIYDVNVDGNRRGFIRDSRGRYRTVQVPGAVQTQAYGINNRGHVVGDYYGADGVPHGFLWRHGRFTTIDGPNGTGATLTEINDRGEIIGVYSDDLSTAGYTGFLLSRGRYSTFDTADATFTLPLGLNDRGQIVGTTFDALGDGIPATARGFALLAGVDEPRTPIAFPGAPASGATGINDRGQIVGRYANPDAGPDTNEER